MADFITGIDHSVIVVRDMDAARAAYERLGFTVTPRGSHLEWGTGNWCMMFPHDYLELRGNIDPKKSPHHLQSIIEKEEGLMGVALGTDDADAAHEALVERGLHPQPVRHLTRNFELPEGLVQPRFSLCFLDESESGGMMSVVLCQHLTPELLRKPAWLQHENTAAGVHSLTCVVPDLDEADAAHQKIFGAHAVRREEDRLLVHVGPHGMLVVTTATVAANRYPRLDVDKQSGESFLAVATFLVDDLAYCSRLLESRRVEHDHGPTDGICVAPGEACGALLEFVSTSSSPPPSAGEGLGEGIS